MNWLHELPNDETQLLLDWMCSEGTTTTLKMLASLRSASKHWRGLIDGRVKFCLCCDPRRTLLTTIESNELCDILKCHRVFASADLYRLPDWIDENEVDDNECDKVFNVNQEGVCKVVANLQHSLQCCNRTEHAPKAVEHLALSHVASSLTTDDEQLFMILGGYFGSVDLHSPKCMGVRDATRIGKLLARSRNSAAIPHFVSRMAELQEDLEANVKNARKRLARLEALPDDDPSVGNIAAYRAELERDQATVDGARGTLSLALLSGWWRNKQPTAALSLTGELTHGTDSLTCVSLLSAISWAVNATLPHARPEDDEEEDDGRQLIYTPVRGTPAQHVVVGRVLMSATRTAQRHGAPTTDAEEEAIGAVMTIANEVIAALQLLGPENALLG